MFAVAAPCAPFEATTSSFFLFSPSKEHLQCESTTFRVPAAQKAGTVSTTTI
jgi:hypothetical protein